MKQIKLTQNKVAIVDDGDYELLAQWKWHANNQHGNWYAINPKMGRMHRFVMNNPIDLEVDHLNGDGLDNRRCNLRACTHSQNMMNQKAKTCQTSKYKGVWWQKDRKKWVSSIRLNQQKIYVGSFLDEGDAGRAYNKKARELYGGFAKLNIIEKGN